MSSNPKSMASQSQNHLHLQASSPPGSSYSPSHQYPQSAHSATDHSVHLTNSYPANHYGLGPSPSISLSLSSLSPTKPLHPSPSTSAASSTCSSPPSYKISTLPPFYASQVPNQRWVSPFRHIRCHPAHFFKSRLSQLAAFALVFFLGYFFGAHPNQPVSSTSPSVLSRFALPIHRHPMIPFRVTLPSPPAPQFAHDRRLQLSPKTHKVPLILHYVFGMAPDFGGKPFGFIHYASIQSAVQILRPTEVRFHYLHRPTGWWFDRALEIEGFTLVKAREVNEIYGRPVKHFAHKADIIRLEALRDHGGIYLDLDVFVVRNFDPLLDQDVVLGQEARPRPTFARRPGSEAAEEPVGLCNAVILAKPFAPFIVRWLASYATFDHSRWADHSSVIPWALARDHPDELTVLGPRAFFYPLWHEDDLWLVHKTTDWDFDRSGQYVYHAWSSISYATYLKALDPDRIHASGGPDRGESSFTYFVRRFIHDPIREQWREARRNRTLGV